MNHQYVWINGKILTKEEANISIFTHSFHYSGSVFEGEMCYNGKIFKLEAHTKRLLKSAQLLKIKVPYSAEEIIRAHQILINKNNIINAYIRPIIYYGDESMNIVNDNLSANLAIMTIAINSKPKIPLKLIQTHWIKPSSNSFPIEAKSSNNYALMSICKKEALELGYDDALLLDNRDYISETTTTNIFFIKDGKLITPITDNCLNGITRQTIIEIAHKYNILISEKYIAIEELSEFDECFLTGTAAEVRMVKSIKTISNKNIIFKSHHLTEFFINQYNNIVMV
jgi:branched-chain amino acid aminotransferase